MSISFCFKILFYSGGSEVKASAWNAGDPASIPGLGRSPREGNGYPLKHSCLENTMDRGTWQPTIHEITKSQRQQLNNKNKSIFRD